MTSWAKDGTTVSYTWDASGNRTKAGSTTATYDARNRQLTDGTTTYAYTARGTLSSVNTGSGSARSLTFDAFERKITDGGTTFTYDSLDRVQTRGATTFTYDGGSNNLANDGTTNYNRTPDGTLLSLSTGTTKQWALTDQHTDLVTALTADGKQVSGSTAYDPFGKETATNGTTPAVGYQSGFTDPTTGDVNMAARWYQPGTGSFASRDTWQLDPVSAQANRYSYGDGGPLGGTDPTGHRWNPSNGGAGMGPVPIMSAGRLSGTKTKTNTKTNRSSTSRRTGSSVGGRATSRQQAQKVQKELGLRSSASGSRTPVRTTTRTSGVRGCTYGCKSSSASRGTGNGTGRGTTRPPAPRIKQNPNNGKNATPAPTRTVPRAKVDAGRTQQRSLDRAAVVDQRVMVDLVGNKDYTPDAQGLFESAPAQGGDQGSATRDSSDCTRDGQGWVDYGDSGQGGRATGVEACLDTAYLDAHPGSSTQPDKVTPPGYQWARAYAGYLGNRPPGQWVNACHLLGADLSGDGTNLENLSTCARSANANRVSQDDPGIPEHMYYFERQVKAAIDGGQTVHYQVTPVYSGARTVPVAYEMTAWGTVNGKPGLMLEDVVPNMMYSNKFGYWRNIGLASSKGTPVPLAGTP